jgi:hypothetical protein
MSVGAESSLTLRYQWLRNNQPISGETNATLRLSEVQTNHIGLYSVVVSNVAGSVSSATVRLRVNQYPLADASATPTLLISPNGTSARVILDASRSTDPDGDALTYLWLSTLNAQP